MARSLNTFVHVPDESGAMVAFGPGDEVPAWARKAITNPRVWDGAEEPAEVVAPKRAARSSKSE